MSSNYDQYEDEADPWDGTKHKQQCESIKGCIWQRSNERMICEPGPQPSLIKKSYA